VLYERFVDDSKPPGADAVAEALDIPVSEAEAAYRRLDENHAIVLMPGTLEIWMAAPLSAVRTPFAVETPSASYFGNCVWDGLGVLAMLEADGKVETRCADCDEPMTLRVGDGKLAEGEGVAHFAVPARRWWENIGFT
jgi:Alkylmercury lyase